MTERPADRSDRYAPDDLGSRKVHEQVNGAPHVALATAACRHLNVESGDRVVFEKQGESVVARKADTEDGDDGGQMPDQTPELIWSDWK